MRRAALLGHGRRKATAVRSPPAGRAHIGSPMSAAALIGGLCRWTDVLFPDAERGARMKAALLDRFGADQRAVSADVCAEIEAVAQRFARHVALEYTPDGTLTPDVQRAGLGAAGSRRGPRQSGIGTARRAARRRDRRARARRPGPHRRLRALVESAFDMLHGCSGLVLDLRANGGGDPAPLWRSLPSTADGGPGPIHVSDIVYRERARQWWTAGGPPALAIDTPVVALIGSADVLLG